MRDFMRLSRKVAKSFLAYLLGVASKDVTKQFSTLDGKPESIDDWERAFESFIEDMPEEKQVFFIDAFLVAMELNRSKIKEWCLDKANAVYSDDEEFQRYLRDVSRFESNVVLHLENARKILVMEEFEESEKKGTGKVKPSVKPFNWQGTQGQLVFLIEQLYEQGFLSPISQTEKHSLTAQHFTVKGESLNPRTLAQIRQNSLNSRGGKPKGVEEIEKALAEMKKQSP
jgi:hypothetical protein